MFVAVFNVWDHEHLRKSVDNIKKVVDSVVIVWSQMSNYGNRGDFNPDDYKDCVCVRHEPRAGMPRHKELEKRNVGLEKARKLGAKYFLMMDCDEFYHVPEVIKWYEYLKASDLAGLVCKTMVYVKTPTLCLEDVTYVTFIHKLTRGLKFEFNKDYPFAHHEDHNRIDPTRRLNITEGVELIDCYMHHYSWVRKDPNTKAFNSTARNTTLKSNIFKDLALAKPGYFCEFYGKELHETENHFGL